MLVDLTRVLPESFPLIMRAGTILLFGWWFLLRQGGSRSWSFRPTWAEA